MEIGHLKKVGTVRYNSLIFSLAMDEEYVCLFFVVRVFLGRILCVEREEKKSCGGVLKRRESKEVGSDVG